MSGWTARTAGSAGDSCGGRTGCRQDADDSEESWQRVSNQGVIELAQTKALRAGILTKGTEDVHLVTAVSLGAPGCPVSVGNSRLVTGKCGCLRPSPNLHKNAQRPARAALLQKSPNRQQRRALPIPQFVFSAPRPNLPQPSRCAPRTARSSARNPAAAVPRSSPNAANAPSNRVTGSPGFFRPI